MIVPAWFQTYRPRLGLADTLVELADEADTMLALYIPASFARLIRWHDDRVDAAATFAEWQGDGRRIVTFAAYTGELEADVTSRGQRSCGRSMCACAAEGDTRASSVQRSRCEGLATAVCDARTQAPPPAAMTDGEPEAVKPDSDDTTPVADAAPSAGTSTPQEPGPITTNADSHRRSTLAATSTASGAASSSLQPSPILKGGTIPKNN